MAKGYETAERRAIITEMVAEVEDWDLDTLIGFAQGMVETRLLDLSDEDLLQEYASFQANGE